MHKKINKDEYDDILRTIRKGSYCKQGGTKTRIECLSLGFLKYLVYSEMDTWRRGCPNQFSDCPLTRGQRSKAIFFLHGKGVVHPNANKKRWFCKNRDELVEKLKELEKKMEKNG